MSANLFSLFILVVIANTALSGLLPRIQDDYVQLEPTDDNNYSYNLKITHPEGAELVETVREGPPGNLQVKGVYKNTLKNPSKPTLNGNLEVVYTADTDGYLAKYSYAETNFPPIAHLPANVVKSLVG